MRDSTEELLRSHLNPKVQSAKALKESEKVYSSVSIAHSSSMVKVVSGSMNSSQGERALRKAGSVAMASKKLPSNGHEVKQDGSKGYFNSQSREFSEAKTTQKGGGQF